MRKYLSPYLPGRDEFDRSHPAELRGRYGRRMGLQTRVPIP
jgi:hypothetical protein